VPASGNDFTCRPGKPRKGDFASKPPRPSSPARCLGKDTPGTRKWLRKELAPQANRPTFAGEPRRKCPRNRSGSLARWVFGESRVLLRRAIVAVSPVMGRVGSGRRGFGCWIARVSAGALQPESDSRVSVVFATCRGPRSRSERGGCFAHHAHRFSRSRPVRGERTSLGKGSDRRRVLDFG